MNQYNLDFISSEADAVKGSLRHTYPSSNDGRRDDLLGQGDYLDGVLPNHNSSYGIKDSFPEGETIPSGCWSKGRIGAGTWSGTRAEDSMYA